MNTLIKILIVIVITLLVGAVIKIGMAKEEKVACKKLEYQAQNYKGFYYTKDEALMCGLGVD